MVQPGDNHDPASKLTNEIDEGLERDLRAALGWDDEDETPQEDSNELAGEQQPSPGEEQPKPDDDPEIELDGEKVKLSQVRSWRQGHLMLNDYTRKTQQLAEERRKLDEQRQRYQMYEQIDSFLLANPHVAAAVRQVLSGQLPATTQPIAGQQLPRTPGLGTPTPTMPPFGSSTQRQPIMPPSPTVPWQGVDPFLDQRLSKLEQSHYDYQLDRTLEQIRAQANAERKQLGLDPLDDAKWNELSTRLMQTAVESKTTDLNLVFKMDTQARIEWANEAVERAKQASRASNVDTARRTAGAVINGGVRGGSVAPQRQTSPKDFAEATRQAYLDLRREGVSLFSSDE